MAVCFVIMPFRPELRYLYERLKQHIEETFHDVRVDRADDIALTEKILDSIVSSIDNADVIIADCTGRNPNVFYELGMAHAKDKRVVLISSDPADQAPTDIRAYKLISYAGETASFLKKLNAALEEVLGNPFEGLYQTAVELFEQFQQDAGIDAQPVSQPDFTSTSALGKHLPRNEGRERDELLIRRLLGVDANIDVLNKLVEWLDQRHPQP